MFVSNSVFIAAVMGRVPYVLLAYSINLTHILLGHMHGDSFCVLGSECA